MRKVVLEVDSTTQLSRVELVSQTFLKLILLPLIVEEGIAMYILKLEYPEN